LEVFLLIYTFMLGHVSKARGVNRLVKEP